MGIMNTITERAPYIVSADVAGALSGWANENGLFVPSKTYFDAMTDELRATLEQVTSVRVEIIPEEEMYDGMNKLVHNSDLPVYSLDRAYLDDSHPKIAGHIDATRAVREVTEERGNPIFENIGLLARPGYLPLDEQVEVLRASHESPIALVDDVIFSGKGTVEIAEKLKAVGRRVVKVYAGIGVKEGIDLIESAEIEIECAKVYNDVTDEVCQRDFFAGVPMSGRTVLGDNGDHWSAPYFRPLGDPEDWASIPSNQVMEFSRFCLGQSLGLWREIEASSGRAIPAKMVPRHLKGVPDQARFIDILQQYIDLL